MTGAVPVTMSLAPSRFLVPVRSVEPANYISLGSLCCSRSLHYHHLSFRFPYNRRSRRSFFSSFSEVDGQSSRNHHNHIAFDSNTFGEERTIQQDEDFYVDELQALYEEERCVATSSEGYDVQKKSAFKSRYSEDGFRSITSNENKMKDNRQPWSSSSSGRTKPPWVSGMDGNSSRKFIGKQPSLFDPHSPKNRSGQGIYHNREQSRFLRPEGQTFAKDRVSRRSEPRPENVAEPQRQQYGGSLWQEGQTFARDKVSSRDEQRFENAEEEIKKPMPWLLHRQQNGGPGNIELPLWNSPSHVQRQDGSGSDMASYYFSDRKRNNDFEQESFDSRTFWKDLNDSRVNDSRSKNSHSWQNNQYMERESGRKSEPEGNWIGNPSEKNSAISRIMEKLQDIQDRTGVTRKTVFEATPRSRLADSLSLPKADEYLKDKNMLNKSVSESEREELDARFPWETEKSEGGTNTEAQTKAGPLTLAELTIPAPELRRLRILSLHLKQRVKIGKHGVSRDIVNSILQRWQTCEVVKVKCEGAASGNMKKTLETLEEKTSGLVIWKAGSVAVLYRGKDFGQPVSEIVDNLLEQKLAKLKSSDLQSRDEVDFIDNLSTDASDVANKSDISEDSTNSSSPKPDYNKIEEYNSEVEDILTALGPKYEDWTGPKPVPVDADLLPPSPNYHPPFRLLPYGVRPSLGNILATHLRRISRNLPPHFVIGRDRDLQGLASAIVKLWEKSEIAKVGYKRGILNTNQERIAEDIKQLTGGLILCRDKRSVTFHRGKDFLPEEVAIALRERQAMSEALQNEEVRVRAEKSIAVQQGKESSDTKMAWVQLVDPEERIRLKKEAAKARRLQIIQHLERKIRMALKKKEKAERELEKVEEFLKPLDQPADRETITEEERFMLRKLGLKMKAFLLVGRRGVFSGVVQNMHLHWKHRELVKIIIKERDPAQLKKTAEMLANESGGVLVAVEPTSKGHAIIVYRGKNYSRPPQLRPPNLLTKRTALKRSIEMQRREAFLRHIKTLEEEIILLRAGLSNMNNENNTSSCEGEDDQLQLNKQSNMNNENNTSSCEGEDDQLQLNKQDEIIHMEGRVLKEASSKSVTLENSEESCSDNYIEINPPKISKRTLRMLSEMGPVFRAERLSLRERHEFRNDVEKLSKAAHFLVGTSRPLTEIAKGIRIFFLDNAFVKIGLRGRPPGTSVQDIGEELEDLTGGTIYAQDKVRVILYRGWPSGTEMPTSGIYDVLSPEQCDVLEESRNGEPAVESHLEGIRNSECFQMDEEDVLDSLEDGFDQNSYSFQSDLEVDQKTMGSVAS